MDTDFPQRRRFPRVPAENAVLVRRLGEESMETVSKTRDVGLGGCCFTSAQSFGIGSLLKVMITVDREIVDCLARVVYENDSGAGIEIGIEFLFLPEANRARIRTIFDEQDPPDST